MYESPHNRPPTDNSHTYIRSIRALNDLGRDHRQYHRTAGQPTACERVPDAAAATAVRTYLLTNSNKHTYALTLSTMTTTTIDDD